MGDVETFESAPTEEQQAGNKTKLTRRQLFKRWSVGLAGVAGLSCAADGLFIEPHGYTVTRIPIKIPGLPDAWEGTTLAQISDMHIGPLSNMDEARNIVDLTNSLKPDIVVLTGDYVSEVESITASLADVLRDLRPKIGAVGVLGNHDYWTDAGAIHRTFESAGIPILVNRHKMFTRNRQALCLAGVDDLMAGWPDAEKALQSVPDRMTRIVLCHNPDYAESISENVKIDLMICGHTHGGQVRLPLIGPLILPIKHRKYAEGFVKGPHFPVFISRGLGMVSFPIRFNCRPEIPLITLKKG